MISGKYFKMQYIVIDSIIQIGLRFSLAHHRTDFGLVLTGTQFSSEIGTLGSRNGEPESVYLKILQWQNIIPAAQRNFLNSNLLILVCFVFAFRAAAVSLYQLILSGSFVFF